MYTRQTPIDPVFQVVSLIISKVRDASHDQTQLIAQRLQITASAGLGHYAAVAGLCMLAVNKDLVIANKAIGERTFGSLMCSCTATLWELRRVRTSPTNVDMTSNNAVFTLAV